MFKIRTETSQIVSRFSSEHQIVQVAGDPRVEKKFTTRAQAERFIKRYADAGYGLSSSATIIEDNGT